MGYAVAVILIMGIVLLSMASLIKDNGKALNKDKQAKGRQVKEVIKERRYPYFYVKNCIFYPDEAAQFSYDESEYNFLKEKYEEFSKSLDYAQMLKICDEIIKIDWRSSKVWMDAINALFSDVLKNKYEWDESLSRKTVTYCYGYMQTFNNALDRSLEVKHNLIPAVMRRIKEVITYQKENFSELHNFEVYNMLINIYYMLPFRELLDCAYKYLLEDKITEDLNNTVYTQRSIRSILGHIEMLKAKYKTDITEEINPDENKGFSIDEYILVNDETFNTTFISFSINYPLGTNKVSIEFHFYDEQGKEIFLGRNNRIYIETFEIKNPISTKENFDIVIIGEDSIRSIELKLYKGNKDEVKDAEGQQENKSTASNSNTSEGNKSEASNTNPAQEKELKAELSKVGTAQVKVNKTEVPSNNIAKEKQNKEGTSNINAVKENKISGKTDNLNSAQNKANGELKKRDKTAEGLEFAKAAENSDEQNNEEEIFDTETTQGLKDEKNEEMLLFPSFKNVKEISLSELHFLALKNDGTVIGIGNDSKLTKVQNWSDIEKIYTTNFASYGIKKDGTLIITGKNEYDSLEHEYIWEGIKKIVPSYTHIIGLKDNGTIVAVGDNSNKQCNVSEWYEVIDISASFHSVGLTKEGKVLATGENAFGECDVGKWEDIVQIATGPFYTVGLKSDGTVLATGLNSCGQCNVSEWKNIKNIYARGNITVGLKYNGEAVVTGNNSYRFDDIKKWNNIVDIKIVNDRIIGIDEEGAVLYKGKPYKGRMGEEWRDIEHVAANSNSIVGLKKDGNLICNDILFGVYLKDGVHDFIDIKEDTDSGKIAILQKNGEVKLYNRNDYDNYSYDCARFKNIKNISVSDSILVGLKDDGTAVITGNDLMLSIDVEMWNNLIKVEAGKDFVVGLKINGKVVAAGDNSYGKCEVKSWDDIIDIAVLGNKALGLRADGTVLGAGLNEFGELDFIKIFNNIIGIAITKKQIMLLDINGNVRVSYHPEGIKNEKLEKFKNVKKIVARDENFIGLKSDGTVVTTMDNDGEIKIWDNINDIGASGSYIWGKRVLEEDKQ